MIPWIVGAAVLVLAYVVYTASRGGGGAKGKPPGPGPAITEVLDATITINKTETGEIVVPDTVRKLYAKETHRLLWKIENNTGRAVDVSLRNFKPAKPGSQDPLTNPANERRNFPNPDEIRDTVKPKANCGNFKYDVYVDGVMKLDPDLEVIN